MLSDDDAAPVDRPNLSKDYLAGNAPEDWVPLRPDSFYSKQGIDLQLNANVAGIDPRSRDVVLSNGSKVPYDRLLLATGAEPVRLSIPGADLPHGPRADPRACACGGVLLTGSGRSPVPSVECLDVLRTQLYYFN